MENCNLEIKEILKLKLFKIVKFYIICVYVILNFVYY